MIEFYVVLMIASLMGDRYHKFGVYDCVKPEVYPKG